MIDHVAERFGWVLIGLRGLLEQTHNTLFGVMFVSKKRIVCHGQPSFRERAKEKEKAPPICGTPICGLPLCGLQSVVPRSLVPRTSSFQNPTAGIGIGEGEKEGWRGMERDIRGWVRVREEESERERERETERDGDMERGSQGDAEREGGE
eukprot:4855995-Karenia_brevis.AAC.1